MSGEREGWGAREREFEVQKTKTTSLRNKRIKEQYNNIAFYNKGMPGIMSVVEMISKHSGRQEKELGSLLVRSPTPDMTGE